MLRYRQYTFEEVVGQHEGIGSTAVENIWAARDLSQVSCVGHLHVIGSISFNGEGPTH